MDELAFGIGHAFDGEDRLQRGGPARRGAHRHQRTIGHAPHADVTGAPGFLTGTIEELLGSPSFTPNEQDWVCAILTDQVRPMDAMSRLKSRFPNCATLEFAPAVVAAETQQTYGSRVVGKSDSEVVDGFLGFVRNGVAASDFESRVVNETLVRLATEAAER